MAIKTNDEDFFVIVTEVSYLIVSLDNVLGPVLVAKPFLAAGVASKLDTGVPKNRGHTNVIRLIKQTSPMMKEGAS